MNYTMSDMFAQYMLNQFSKESGIPYNLNDPNYDYRRALMSGARPTKESGYHWPSRFKGASHPNRIIRDVWGRFLDTKTGEIL